MPPVLDLVINTVVYQIFGQTPKSCSSNNLLQIIFCILTEIFSNLINKFVSVTGKHFG